MLSYICASAYILYISSSIVTVRYDGIWIPHFDLFIPLMRCTWLISNFISDKNAGKDALEPVSPYVRTLQPCWAGSNRWERIGQVGRKREFSCTAVGGNGNWYRHFRAIWQYLLRMKTLNPIARRFRLTNKSSPPKVNCGFLFYSMESIKHTIFLHDLTFVMCLHIFSLTRHSQPWERDVSSVLSRRAWRTDAGTHSCSLVLGSKPTCWVFSSRFASCS